MWRHGSIAAVVVLGACAGAATPVPIAGTATDLQALAGEWSGEYWSAETGRSGSIVFRLRAGTDSASGDVIMSPARGPRGAPQEPNAAPAGQAPAAPQVLAISFVRVEGGRVSGRLGRYQDPVCGCDLFTVFEGALKGDTLEGTYTSRHAGTQQVQSGQWLVRRQR